MRKNILPLTLLLLVHIFLLFNLRFTAWPEMLSYPFLYNNEFSLYKDIIYPYPPLLTLKLASVYGFFGYGLTVVKVFTFLVILANDFLVFFIVNKLTGSKKIALASLGFYVFLQPFLEGNMLWFDTVIVLPMLFGTYFLLSGGDKKPRSYFWAGLFFTIAALVKQTTGLFLILGSIYLVRKERGFLRLRHFLLAPIIIGTLLLIKLVINEELVYFLNWVLVYPLTMWSSFPGYVQTKVADTQLLIIFLLSLPLLLLLFPLKKSFLRNNNLIFLLTLLLVSIIGVYPRFSFFHFQLPLAYLAIFFGVFLARIKKLWLVVPYSLFLFYFIQRPALPGQWRKEARFYGGEDLERAKIIQKVVKKEETVYLLGPQSGLYVLADRLPPKPWTDNFGWYLEIPEVQEEIIGRWSDNPPDYIFWQEPKAGNWYDLATYQPKKITKWIEERYTRGETAWESVEVWRRKD